MSDILASVVRNWSAVTVLRAVLVEVELFVFETEVTDSSRWLQTTLDITGLRVSISANKNILFSFELFLQTLLFALFVCV